MHRKQVAENNSKETNNYFAIQKNICIIASKYIEFSISQELPLLKNDDVSNN